VNTLGCGARDSSNTPPQYGQSMYFESQPAVEEVRTQSAHPINCLPRPKMGPPQLKATTSARASAQSRLKMRLEQGL
jgi:hypothetical protein